MVVTLQRQSPREGNINTTARTIIIPHHRQQEVMDVTTPEVPPVTKSTIRQLVETITRPRQDITQQIWVTVPPTLLKITHIWVPRIKING